MKQRKGRFSFSHEAINSVPEAVKKVMGKCIILECSSCPHLGLITYVALCDEFDKIREDETPPFYNWTFSNREMKKPHGQGVMTYLHISKAERVFAGGQD